MPRGQAEFDSSVICCPDKSEGLVAGVGRGRRVTRVMGRVSWPGSAGNVSAVHMAWRVRWSYPIQAQTITGSKERINDENTEEHRVSYGRRSLAGHGRLHHHRPAKQASSGDLEGLWGIRVSQVRESARGPSRGATAPCCLRTVRQHRQTRGLTPECSILLRSIAD
jgi:hypothetical protein